MSKVPTRCPFCGSKDLQTPYSLGDSAWRVQRCYEDSVSMTAATWGCNKCQGKFLVVAPRLQ